jgi:hypothetical protein
MYSRDDFPDGAPVGIDPRSEPPPRSAKNAAVGFGSPGSDATVKRIDLNDALIRHPQATFLMRAVDNAEPVRHRDLRVAHLATVGTCGRLGRRLSLVIARARTLPTWMDGSAA